MRSFLFGSTVLFAIAMTGSAFAADMRMPVKARPVPPPPAFSWSGCYIGVEGGGAWGRSSQVARSGADAGLPITGDFDLSGGLLGGSIGCNYQVNSFVFGIEDDLSWTNKTGSHSDIPPFNVAALSTTREKWLDTLRGRAGFAVDRFFFYGTGGAAWAGTEVNVTNVARATDSQTRTGWAVGVGGEWAAWTLPTGALTFKLEYLHADFGTASYINPPVITVTGTTVTRDVKLTDDIFRAGMNWKFGGWDTPVSTRY
jgi:outer membrane immunogenic protein